ncbi:hypothetical protein KUTeg_023280 [Tegillarca granosa]|uniref:IgGFc-binding protein N-terminal domain-containing protein n=1 Tax=Tegillarca granosa TaxID=220873 RepID=A0ABQ9E6S9_TEGGR|nr:hypothetical protein KUTeg_023280 [Tegillarca granosa]
MCYYVPLKKTQEQTDVMFTVPRYGHIDYVIVLLPKQKTQEQTDVMFTVPRYGHIDYIELLAEDGAVLYRTNPIGESLDGGTVDQSKYQAFNAFSPNGIVQGELVYANYGTRSDFETLKQKGINCTGKIVIARYGQIFRGNKNAIAVL